MSTQLRALDRAPHVELNSRAAWRSWLSQNHAAATGVWLVSPRHGRAERSLSYEAAVEEALCFGWIDGQAASVDEQRSKQYFAPRRARSLWSAPNKVRLQRMLDAGRVESAGLAVAERARSDGTWSVLESVDRLELPPDLALAFASYPAARRGWDEFPRSVQRQLLASIVTARREETRARRINAIVSRCTKRRQLVKRDVNSFVL